MYVCVFVGHGLRSTSFFHGVAKKSEVPICSASTSLTYPSSICQADTRTTTGDHWRCKLQRNKHELPVNTPSPNTHRLLVLQISPLHSERRQYFFFNCTSAILLALVEVLFIAFSRISTKSVEPIANFKPRGKCIWLIARVVAQTLFTVLIINNNNNNNNNNT